MSTKFITKSEGETKKLGERLLKEIIKERKDRRPVVVLLKGELGGGKTTFTQGIASALNIKGRILSPTFIIIRKVPILKRRFKFLYHIDCYRIKNVKDLKELNIEEILEAPESLIVIEWPEVIRGLIKEPYWEVVFHFLGRNKREIMIRYKK